MSLQITLENQSTSDQLYVIIVGFANPDGSGTCFIESDGVTQYFPENPAQVGTPLTRDVAINVGPPGNSVVATVPYLVGGRIWFSIGKPLTFLVDPSPTGARPVAPNVNNTSDPNYNTSFSFAEFTFNTSELFANLSYVDVVGIPNALTLTETNGETQHAAGMPADGLQQVVSGLQAQTESDGQPWASLYQNNLRVISPVLLMRQNDTNFAGYFEGYVNECWQRYSSGSPLVVNTQSAFGDLEGTTVNNVLTFSDGSTFNQPSTFDVFTNDQGALGPPSSASRLTIIPRIAAALNRSTLLDVSTQPNGAEPSQYYQNAVTNHYARILHEVNLDGRGYAYPYDEVRPDNGSDPAGIVRSSNPQMLTVTIGGGNATADLEVASKRQKVLLAKAKKVSGTPVAQQAAKLA